MYDIRQFRPALYVLLLLGMTGFALAASSPGMWVLSVSAILLNAWVVKAGRFVPLPRLVANVLTVSGLLLMVVIVRRGATTPILVIGQFLVLLQIVKLYEQRANRDFAQLLVLSLLLMVAAAISTASLLFGLMFIAYLFLSLYCCLLFHLKVETDYAKRAIGIPEEKLNPATLRQDQRYLSQSMRRLTALVSSFSIVTAVLTFLFIPRGAGAGLLAPLQWKPAQTLTGFSDKVSFQNVARITQNNQLVAYVKLTRDGQKWYGAQPLLLRGITLDNYSGAGDYQWSRTIGEGQVDDFRGGEWRAVGTPAPLSGALRQEITLEPTGTQVLFAVGGIVAFKPSESGRFRYSREDEVLQAVDLLMAKTSYEVISSEQLTQAPSPRPARPQVFEQDDRSGDDSVHPPGRSRIDPRIEQFVRRPDVSGSDEHGPLAERRPRDARVTELDGQIAQNIETYLRRNFAYTLDLTDARRIEDQDPMVAFLYDLKRGHCEFFAGAMALMCQSLGMQARLVVGFKCDNYNALGGVYVVQQSHAHAWVEVLTFDGRWRTFDPTSGREGGAARRDTLWSRARRFFDFLEYTWASSVVAYDRESRSNLIQRVDTGLTKTAVQGGELFAQSRRWLGDNLSTPRLPRVIGAMIGAMLVVMVLSVFWFFYERWKLRRRVKRIGLDALPTRVQVRLARQLGFYDDLMQLLARHRIYRPDHLTPMEFSRSLTFLPTAAFNTIRRLTEVFYRIRYGQAEIGASRRRRLGGVIARLDSVLGGFN